MNKSSRFSGLLKKPRETEPEEDPVENSAPSPTIPVEKKIVVSIRPKGRSHPDNKGRFVSTTVYLDRSVHKPVRSALLDDGRDLSELVEELLTAWLGQRKG